MFSVICPSEEWVGGGNLDCYYFGKDTGDVNFFEAEEFCRSLHKNAGLAEIHDDLNQNFISLYIGNQYDWWLGATDEYQVCTYENLNKYFNLKC